MILQASFRVTGTRIDYAYNTEEDTHNLWLAGPATRYVSGSPGEIISALAPYRGNQGAWSLVKWLSK